MKYKRFNKLAILLAIVMISTNVTFAKKTEQVTNKTNYNIETNEDTPDPDAISGKELQLYNMIDENSIKTIQNESIDRNYLLEENPSIKPQSSHTEVKTKVVPKEIGLDMSKVEKPKSVELSKQKVVPEEESLTQQERIDNMIKQKAKEKGATSVGTSSNIFDSAIDNSYKVRGKSKKETVTEPKTIKELKKDKTSDYMSDHEDDFKNILKEEQKIKKEKNKKNKKVKNSASENFSKNEDYMTVHEKDFTFWMGVIFLVIFTGL